MTLVGTEAATDLAFPNACEEGYLNRGELEKSKQAAHAKPPALRSWLKADLDKAQTHADRERVMKEVQRRMK